MMKAGLLIAVFGLSLLDSPSSFAAPGVASWNSSCSRFYSRWKKKPNHKAFAVATSSTEQSCGGSWGANSIKAAEDSARQWCKKSATDAHCIITKSE